MSDERERALQRLEAAFKKFRAAFEVYKAVVRREDAEREDAEK